MDKPSKKRILSLISFIVSAAIFAFALSVFIISFKARSKNRPAEFFGYSFAVVVTDSMSPQINVGDLIIVKSCDIMEMKVKQNAVFVGVSGSFKDKCIVHQVVGVYDDIDENGVKSGVYLQTWGINNLDYDDDFVYAENFIGREIFHSKTLGAIMVFLREPLNWIYVLVFMLAISFVVHQSVKIIKHFKNKEVEQPTTESAAPEITETVNSEVEQFTTDSAPPEDTEKIE